MTSDEWAPLFQHARKLWPTLPTDGGAAWFRHVQHLPTDVAAAALDELAATMRDRITVADVLAVAGRVLEAERDAAAAEQRRADDEPRDEPATDYRSAYRVAKQRRERGLSLGFGQYLMTTSAENAQRAADLLAGNGPRQADGHGYGAFLRATLRACDDADRDGALRRLANHMPPDDHAVLTDAVTP